MEAVRLPHPLVTDNDDCRYWWPAVAIGIAVVVVVAVLVVAMTELSLRRALEYAGPAGAIGVLCALSLLSSIARHGDGPQPPVEPASDDAK